MRKARFDSAATRSHVLDRGGVLAISVQVRMVG